VLALTVMQITQARLSLAQDADDGEARKYFEMGVGYLDDPDGERVEEAYHAFKRAYELSKSPKVLGNVGLCAMKLERDGEAIDAYSEYLRLPEIDPDERAQIERDLRALSASVARITITVERPNTILVDSRAAVRGETITNAYGPVERSITLRVRQGHHVIRAKRDGIERDVWEFDANPAGSLAHAFREEARPVPAETGAADRGVHPAAWLLSGVGAAALVAGAATGLAANRKVAQLERDCPGGACATSYDLDRNRQSAQTLATLTNVLLLGGGVVTLAGVTWLVTHEASSSGPERASTSDTSVSAGAACLPGACAVNVGLRL
jgi:hypothetical protein